MAKYLFIYHGGSMPETDEEVTEVMGQWMSWLEGLGDSVVDAGNPVGLSSTVNTDGSVSGNGGANPANGYGIFLADSQEEAENIAKKCPALLAGGTVEVAMIVEMD